MYTKYQAEEFLLTADLKKQREDEIVKAEDELKDLQKNRFGYNGDLFKKRQELIQPIQDKVFDAIQKLAQTRSYDFIFDKASGGAAMLYTNPQYDVSEEVIKTLSDNVHEIMAKGSSAFEKHFYLIHFGDWLSYYLGVQQGYDPMEIDVLIKLKGHMSSLK